MHSICKMLHVAFVLGFGYAVVATVLTPHEGSLKNEALAKLELEQLEIPSSRIAQNRDKTSTLLEESNLGEKSKKFQSLRNSWMRAMKEPLPSSNNNTETHSRSKRAAIANKSKLWPNGIIPYVIQEDEYTARAINKLKEVFGIWERETCLIFREKEPGDVSYIIIKKTPCGCCCSVGMDPSGPIVLSLTDSCLKHPIILHELGHAIGYFHEHNRPDRDNYVRINLDNVREGEDYNFKRKDPSEVDSLGVPYDYKSIMHYDRSKFSKARFLDTLAAVLQPGQLIPEDITRNFRLSELDIIQTNKLYKCPSCGGTFQKAPGEFSHELVEKKTETCQYRLKMSPGFRVQLNIISFDIPWSQDCATDYFEVRDGPTMFSPVIGRYCGKEIPQAILSSRERLWTELKTSGRGKGSLKIEFHATVEGYITKEKGQLASPNYPHSNPDNTNISWILTGNPGETFHVNFDEFMIRNAYLSRCDDYVELRDGPDASSPVIGKYCMRKPPPDVKSSGPNLFIRFMTGPFSSSSGFILTYIKDKDECLETPGPCEHTCENTVGGFKCGCNKGMELHSDGRSCIPQCGGEFNQGEGVVYSPSHPDLYSPNKSCKWKFNIRKDQQVFIDFEHFDLEGDYISECNNDHLEVTEGESPSVRSLGTYCGYLTPPQIVSDRSPMTLHFVSDGGIERTGFSFKYIFDNNECVFNKGGCDHYCKNIVGSFVCSCQKAYELQADGKTCKETDQCAETITRPRGVFHSLMFPLIYLPRLDCTWLLKTKLGHKIKLSFRTFYLENHRSCMYDHLEIFDGANFTTPSLGRFCGYRLPDPVISSSNEMFLYFFTDTSKEYLGFYAVHETVCRGNTELRAKRVSQTLDSHGDFDIEDYENRLDCSWTIKADPGNVVEVVFDIFEVEFEEDCAYDSVRIFDGDSDSAVQMGKFCGSEEPEIMVSSGDSMLISFTTDDTIREKGFTLIFHQRLPEETMKRR